MDNKQTLTVEEAAKVLRICRNAAYDAIRAGTIPSIRFGRKIVVPVVALERMLAGESREGAG